MRPHGRHAAVNPGSPEAFAMCDRCGEWWNRSALQWQYQWSGTHIYSLGILVCPHCYDTPFEQLRTIILPPDPPPVINARPPNFSFEEAGPTQSVLLVTVRAGSNLLPIQNVAGFQVGNTVWVQLSNATGSPNISFGQYVVIGINTTTNILTICGLDGSFGLAATAPVNGSVTVSTTPVMPNPILVGVGGVSSGGAVTITTSRAIPATALLIVGVVDGNGQSSTTVEVGSVADGVNAYSPIAYTRFSANGLVSAYPLLQAFQAYSNATLPVGTQFTFTSGYGNQGADIEVSICYILGANATTPIDTATINTQGSNVFAPIVSGAPTVANETMIAFVGGGSGPPVYYPWTQSDGWSNPPNGYLVSRDIFGGFRANVSTPVTYAPIPSHASVIPGPNSGSIIFGVIPYTFVPPTSAPSVPTPPDLVSDQSGSTLTNDPGNTDITPP